jgi:hypothetical protein
VKPDECAVSDDAHTKRTALAFTGAYELDGVEYRIGEAHYGKAVTSNNKGSDTSDPRSVALAVQWIEPVEGAEVGPSLLLSAWPTPVLVDGQLVDPSDVARVDFTASWLGGSAPACSATSADAEDLWSCTADLAAMGRPGRTGQPTSSIKGPLSHVKGPTVGLPGGTSPDLVVAA